MDLFTFVCLWLAFGTLFVTGWISVGLLVGGKIDEVDPIGVLICLGIAPLIVLYWVLRGSVGRLVEDDE